MNDASPIPLAMSPVVKLNEDGLPISEIDPLDGNDHF